MENFTDELGLQDIEREVRLEVFKEAEEKCGSDKECAIKYFKANIDKRINQLINPGMLTGN